MAETYGSPLAADPLDIAPQPARHPLGHQHQAHQPAPVAVRRGGPAAGRQVVVIDPIRTVTADAADWFVQPRPGTDVALMLAMMHVLMRDDLVDHDYVGRHASGTTSSPRTGRLDPERAADVCGVPPTTSNASPSPTAPPGRRSSAPSSAPSTTTNGAMFFRTLAACRCSPGRGASAAVGWPAASDRGPSDRRRQRVRPARTSPAGGPGVAST
jgi:hypothetical protein